MVEYQLLYLSVGFLDFFETLIGQVLKLFSQVGHFIRMVLIGQAAVGRLNLLFGSTRRNPQNLIRRFWY